MIFGDDNELDIERDRQRATALQVLRGEFDSAPSLQLKALGETFLKIDDAICQRGAGYTHAILQQRNTNNKQ